MQTGPYKHLKTGNIYHVKGTVINATNDQDGQVMVLYQSQKGLDFVREMTEFLEKFEYAGS